MLKESYLVLEIIFSIVVKWIIRISFDFSSPEKFSDIFDNRTIILCRGSYVQKSGCKYNILAKIMNVYLSMNPVMI